MEEEVVNDVSILSLPSHTTSCMLYHIFLCPCRSFQATRGKNYLSFTQRRRRRRRGRRGRGPRGQNYMCSSQTEHRWVGERKGRGGGRGSKGMYIGKVCRVRESYLVVNLVNSGEAF